MPNRHAHSLRLALQYAVLLTVGCGLISREEARSAASWCEEEGVGEVATVQITQVLQSGVFEDSEVILRDSEGNTLSEVFLPLQDYGDPGWRTDYTLDERGNVVKKVMDYGLDGTVEKSSDKTYDDEGRLTRTTSDHENDGVVDEIESRTYSTDGALARVEYDTDADGVADSHTTFLWTDTGLLWRITVADSAGTNHETEAYEYDDRGRLVHRVHTDDTRGYILVIDETYEYDANDQLVRVLSLYQGLASLEADDVTLEYDEEGRLTTVLRDYLDDDYVDQIERSTYDSFGRVIRRETHDGSGEFREATEYEYGAGPDPVRTSQDNDGDGTWERVTTWTSCEP